MSVKIFCDWDFNLKMESDIELELFVDRVPSAEPQENIKRIVLLIEPPEISNLQESIFKNTDKFDFLLTHDPLLLEKINKSHLFEFGTSWVKNEPENKEFGVSTLVGGKLRTKGHHLRHDLWYRQKEIKIKNNFYISKNLRGGLRDINNNQILQDRDVLFKTYFHICIENCSRENWFTEKLIDCFRTRTIPIYWGCTNIGKWFDTDGMVIVNDIEELINKTNELTEESYFKRQNSIEQNYLKSKEFWDFYPRLEKKIKNLINL